MQVAIGLYPGFAALDAIGPYQVLAALPGAEVVFCAERAGIVADEDGMLRVEVTHTFDDARRPDVLLVPGGLNTRLIAKDGGPIVEWIRAAHEHTTYTTSVCTGALLLGAAGLLRGLPATTHWLAYDHLRAFGAEPTEQRVVIEGRIATAAGVSAGIDLALTLVGELAGPEVAQAIQLGIEYDPQPPYDTGSPSKAPAPIRELVTAVMRQAEEKLLTEA
jgi:transcriptional regulator GlxA family with amidase domain